MATAMVSAFTGIPIRRDLVMTGEITLRGRVLPIGGLKSKILAAHLSGAKIAVIPRKNEKDLRDIPDEIRKQIKIVLADSMDQVLETALRRRPKPLVATTKIEGGKPAPEDKGGSENHRRDRPVRFSPRAPSPRSPARARRAGHGRRRSASG